MEVEVMTCMNERLDRGEVFWEQGEITLGRVEGLELRFVRRWNEQVSHYDISKTGTSIRNV